MIGGNTSVAPGTDLGLTAGYARSSTDIAGGQTVTSNIGVVGAYGKTDLDVVALTFQILGGASTNHSDRTVNTGTGPQTASADFGGWFIAPEIGASMPVLDEATNEVRIGGKLAYVGGGFAGYTETGNVGVIQVDPQIFGLLTAKLEVSDSMVLGKTAGGEVKGTATVALFAQTNVGGSSVPVTIYQNSGGAALGTSTVSAPTGTVFGTTASLDVKVPVSQQVDFTAGLNGALRSDGALGGGARVGLGGSF